MRLAPWAFHFFAGRYSRSVEIHAPRCRRLSLQRRRKTLRHSPPLGQRRGHPGLKLPRDLSGEDLARALRHFNYTKLPGRPAAICVSPPVLEVLSITSRFPLTLASKSEPSLKSLLTWRTIWTVPAKNLWRSFSADPSAFPGTADLPIGSWIFLISPLLHFLTSSLPHFFAS